MDAVATPRPTYLPNSRWSLLLAVLLTLTGLGTLIMGLGNLQAADGSFFERAPGSVAWIISGVLDLLAGHFLVRGPSRYAKWILLVCLLSRLASALLVTQLVTQGWSRPPSGGWVEMFAFVQALRLSAMDARIEPEPEPVVAQQA